jgi:hypothetical protein
LCNNQCHQLDPKIVEWVGKMSLGGNSCLLFVHVSLL